MLRAQTESGEMRPLRSFFALLLLISLCSCKVFTEANEFKGAFRLDLTAPISWIPGVDYLLPEIVLDLNGGFEWDNYDSRHRREMEKLAIHKEMLLLEAELDESVYEAFLRHLNANPDVLPNVVRVPGGSSD